MNPSLNNENDRCVIHVGVFFDGTGHNGHVYDKTPEETFQVSNIYRLYKCYDVTCPEGKGEKACKVYIEGIGTLNKKPDSIYSIITGDEDIFGLAGYGPDSKLKFCNERMASELVATLSKGDVEGKNISIEFDVFGFSRGAVLARHFINAIHENETTVINTLHRALNQCGHALSGKPVVNFLGLFDTVGTFFDRTVFESDPHDTGYTRNLNVSVPAGAVRSAFQLNAMHEYRYNFPVHSLYGQFPELTVAGAHSDVGGGYPEWIYEVKDLTTHKLWLPFSWAKTRAKKELYPLLRTEQWAFLSKQIDYQGNEKFHCMATSHRRVKGHLQFVALITMVQIAEKCGCVFTPDVKAFEDMIPGELLDYHHHVQQRAVETLEGKPKVLDEKHIQKLVSEYVHLSASWLTFRELYGDLRHNSQLTMSRDSVEDSKQKVIYLSVLNNIWPDRPDENWERKIFGSKHLNLA